MLEPPLDLPQDTRQTYLGFLRESQLTRELLIAKVRKYLDTISRARTEEAGIDVATSSDLGLGLLRLLRECDETGLPHAQAAVYYFLESNDADPDLGSPTGLKMTAWCSTLYVAI